MPTYLPRALQPLLQARLATNAPDQLLSRGARLTLDEVQRAPSLLLAIKRAVDENRAPGRFLLTGSANLELMSNVSETLAGRAVYVTLWPMTCGEVEGDGSVGKWDTFLGRATGDWIDVLRASTRRQATSWTEVARRGGGNEPQPFHHA
jgi:hypothetical protein